MQSLQQHHPADLRDRDAEGAEEAQFPGALDDAEGQQVHEPDARDHRRDRNQSHHDCRERVHDARELRIELAPRVGDSIEVGAITAFVGGPNSGKTEALRDILRLAANFEPLESRDDQQQTPNTKVIRDLTLLGKLSVDRLLRGLRTLPSDDETVTLVQGFGPDIRTAHQVSVGQEIKSILFRPMITSQAVRSTALSALMPIRALYLDSGTRSQLVDPSTATRPDRVPENLLQAMHDAPPNIHQRLDEGFSAAFPGMHLRLDDSARVELTLRISEEFPDTSADSMTELQRYERLARLDEAGDSWRSLAGILLAFLLAEGRIVVIDQPELHLHPETARRLGRWLADNVEELDCQVFLTTNSDALLKGLLDSTAETAVVRVGRDEDATTLNPIAADVCRELANHPLLSNQKGLDCLFCDRVVVVPNPADAVVYEAAAGLDPTLNSGRFFHTHGLRQLPAVTRILRAAKCHLRIVAGMDIFRSSEQFCALFEAATGTAPPRPWLATRERLAQQVEQAFDESSLSADSRHVEEFLEQLEHGEQPLVEMESDSAVDRGWRHVELGDASWLPPELRSWVEDLIQDLKQQGVFLPPREGAASWLRESLPEDKQIPWLLHAVQALRDGNCPPELQAFVTELLR